MSRPRLDPLAEAFAGIAETYDSARPGYSREPFDWAWSQLGLGDGSTVLDLAAGTGKLSQVLAGRGADLLAVEPLAEMRRLLAQRVPEATVLDGTAESIPLQDGAVDAVFVGEAFHWFDGDLALPEIHRVMRPRGGLAVVWNHGHWDLQPAEAELFERLDQVPAPDVRPQNRPYTNLWREPFARLGLFEPMRRQSFERVLQLSIAATVDLMMSWSYVAARPAEERDQLRLDLIAILERHAHDGTIQLGYRTDIDITRRR
jgi:ubiquinone/menaquinone biosynthesis C-methylase UbiE